jgi:hypothetical protein
MTDKIPQTKSELEAHLSEQIHFLEASSLSFDAGYEGEAKRLATTLRVLLHDTKSSKSLLGQLGIKDIQFYDTASEFDPNNLLTHSGLTLLRMNVAGAKHVPLLDETLGRKLKKVDFDKWWAKIVIVDNMRNKMSRKDIVQVVADQDGGAHVDPNLDKTYARLSRQNSFNVFFLSENLNGSQPLSGPHLASIRQIAYEILKTLEDRPKKKHRLRHPKKA